MRPFLTYTAMFLLVLIAFPVMVVYEGVIWLVAMLTKPFKHLT